MKISDCTPGRVMEQVMITHKPPHYMPEISGKLIFGISGNDCLFHDLSEICGSLISNRFGARSIYLRAQVAFSEFPPVFLAMLNLSSEAGR